MNKVILSGRLGKDPEKKTTNTGMAICSLSIATTEFRANNQQETQWHRITVFGKTANNCHAFLKKGSQVLIEGKIQYRNWETATGETRYGTEILANIVEFLGANQNQNKRNELPQSQTQGENYEHFDDIPF